MDISIIEDIEFYEKDNDVHLLLKIVVDDKGVSTVLHKDIALDYDHAKEMLSKLNYAIVNSVPF